MNTRVTIANQTFEFSENALKAFNEFLQREDVVLLNEKYNSQTQGYDYISASKKMKLCTKQVTEWKS